MRFNQRAEELCFVGSSEKILTTSPQELRKRLHELGRMSDADMHLSLAFCALNALLTAQAEWMDAKMCEVPSKFIVTPQS